jgi:hypothetical protein
MAGVRGGAKARVYSGLFAEKQSVVLRRFLGAQPLRAYGRVFGKFAKKRGVRCRLSTSRAEDLRTLLGRWGTWG